MPGRVTRVILIAFAVLLSALLITALDVVAHAQTPPASLTGTVRDPSGAVMQAVSVRIYTDDEDDAEPIRETSTDSQGRFTIALPPGTYRVEISAPAFSTFTRTIRVGPDTDPLDVELDIDVPGLAVDVSPRETLTANTTMSLTSTTMSGDELLDLPRDKEELARYLLELAGADVTGDIDEDILANFIIDGFEDGRLPSPDQIAQIIIDPNSLRADGRGPRIEIVTRPGTGNWEGGIELGFADESLNARTPGEIRKEPRQTRDVELEARGPLVPNLLETTFEYTARSDERAGESLRAVTPGGELFSGVVRPEDQQAIQVGARLQINDRHRLDVELARETRESTNRGVGGFRLPERGSDENRGEWSLQISERMTRPNVSNNARMQVRSRTSRESPLLDGVAIDVADAFMSGGGTTRRSSDDFSVRLDDTLRVERGSWNFQLGGHVQYRNRQSVDRDNYNGTFEFASLHDYCLATNLAGVNCAETARIVADAQAQGIAPVYADARGITQPITGVPTTFTQSSGNADLEIGEVAFDAHLQADKRFGERASLGLGLRYDGTSHSRDFLRFNPNVSFQYRLTEGTIVSAGARLSFNDFTDYERLLRNDGSTYETELTISEPSFPDPFQGGTVAVGEQTASSWVLDPEYKSPYAVEPQFSITQQTPGDVRLTLSYTATHGYRQRSTRNINAPFPGTPLPDEILNLPSDERQAIVDQMRPMFPHVGNVTQIESTGRSVSRTIRLRGQPRGSVTLFGMALSGNMEYTFRTAHDDNDFTNPWARAWGPSRRDHEVQSRFRVRMPETVRVTHPLLRAIARATYENTTFNFRFRANSGRLYSIVSGRDLNGDQSTRDRPPGVARNTETGPGSWTLDMTLTKDVPLSGGTGTDRDGEDGRAGDGGRRGRSSSGDGPRLRFQARVNNLLNETHPRGYGSVVTSSLFGLPTGYTRGRTISMSLGVRF